MTGSLKTPWENLKGTVTLMMDMGEVSLSRAGGSLHVQLTRLWWNGMVRSERFGVIAIARLGSEWFWCPCRLAATVSFLQSAGAGHSQIMVLVFRSTYHPCIHSPHLSLCALIPDLESCYHLLWFCHRHGCWVLFSLYLPCPTPTTTIYLVSLQFPSSSLLLKIYSIMIMLLNRTGGILDPRHLH